MPNLSWVLWRQWLSELSLDLACYSKLHTNGILRICPSTKVLIANFIELCELKSLGAWKRNRLRVGLRIRRSVARAQPSPRVSNNASSNARRSLKSPNIILQLKSFVRIMVEDRDLVFLSQCLEFYFWAVLDLWC